MKNKDTITKFKIFTISDYEKEEVYLREMANKGYHLENIDFPGFYKFRKGRPEDIVYRLDYSGYKTDQKDQYVTMFQDYGWEYLLDFFGWSYFRKDAKEGNIEIFSDNESRLGLVNRVFLTRLLPLILIFIVVFLPKVQNFLRGENYFLINKVFIGLFWLYVVIIIYTGYGLYKLNKKYSKTNKE